jgi:hypothetical protein
MTLGTHSSFDSSGSSLRAEPRASTSSLARAAAATTCVARNELGRDARAARDLDLEGNARHDSSGGKALRRIRLQDHQ